MLYPPFITEPSTFEEYADGFKSMLVKRYNWSVKDAFNFDVEPLRENYEGGLTKYEAYFKVFKDREYPVPYPAPMNIIEKAGHCVVQELNGLSNYDCKRVLEHASIMVQQHSYVQFEKAETSSPQTFVDSLTT